MANPSSDTMTQPTWGLCLLKGKVFPRQQILWHWTAAVRIPGGLTPP